MVALSVDKGLCYGANPLGSRIWQMLSQPQNARSICAVLEREYDVDRETCERDVAAFLHELQAEGLIEIAA